MTQLLLLFLATLVAAVLASAPPGLLNVNAAKIGVEKGKKDGWAANIYKSKYKEWPDSKLIVPVVEISDKTMGYIKSRQIAYAKSNRRYG